METPGRKLQTSPHSWSLIHLPRAALVTQTVQKSACSAEDPGLIPGLGRSSEEDNGNPLQCSCLENAVDRGAWWATVHGLQSPTRLSD